MLWLIARRRKLKKFSNESNRQKKLRITAEFDVLCANGRPRNRAVGVAPTRTRPNFFTVVAGRCGILLKHAENVPFVGINGVGRRVCAAADGRATKIGMKPAANNFIYAR